MPLKVKYNLKKLNLWFINRVPQFQSLFLRKIGRCFSEFFGLSILLGCELYKNVCSNTGIKRLSNYGNIFIPELVFTKSELIKNKRRSEED